MVLKKRRALILHAALFVGAPPWAVVAVMLVPFLSGIGWGWQVQHDRTVVWTMVQHSLIWTIGLQFTLPS
jgi:hypothetical protein